MDRGSARLGAAALALVGLWIVVYWWSPAGPASPSIAFDSRPGESPAQRPATPATLPERKPLDSPPLTLSSPPSSTSATGQPQHPVGEPAPTELKQPAPVPKQPTTPQPTPRQPVVRKPGETIPPTFYLYAVEPGDTAEKISKRFYGSPDQWAAVLKANPQTDFTRLKAGQSIRVPKDPVNIQGVPGSAGGSQSSAPEPGAAKSQPATRYTVKEGDTLGEIAKAFYGKTALWTVIRDANRDLVGDDGRAMRPGQKLTIPPLPSQTPR